MPTKIEEEHEDERPNSITVTLRITETMHKKVQLPLDKISRFGADHLNVPEWLCRKVGL